MSFSVPLLTSGAPKISQITFPAMVAGTASVAVPNWYPFMSQLLGFYRSVSGGSVGLPEIASVSTPTAGLPNATITIISSNVLDASTYIMYWANPAGTAISIGGPTSGNTNTLLP